MIYPIYILQGVKLKMKLEICAGIVTYKPEVERLINNIGHISCQVKTIYIFDNGSSNIIEIKSALSKYQNCVFIPSAINKGIAYALNIMTSRAEQDGFKWILTLDQDSVCSDNMIEEYSRYIKESRVAIFAPYAIDKRRKDRKYNVPTEPITDIDYTFTSGSLVSIDICHYIGDYDNYLFVGLVDTDFCKRIIMNKFRILRCNRVILDQEFGNITPAKNANLFLRLGDVFNNKTIKKLSYHREVSPFRVRYAVRNQIYMMKKYRNYTDVKKDFIMMTIDIFATLLRGDHKMKIIKAIAWGVNEGLKTAPEIFVVKQ